MLMISVSHFAEKLVLPVITDRSGIQSWSRLSEQILRVDKWSVCRG